jgi:hypothetical protein
MNNGSLYPLIQQLWEAGLAEPFTPGVLRSALSNPSCADALDLTEQTILALLNENPPSDWSTVTSALSESSNALLLLADHMSTRKVIAAAFSVCVLADAARAGACDWSLEHDKAMSLCMILASRIHLVEFLPVMAYIFGKGGEPPVAG